MSVLGESFNPSFDLHSPPNSSCDILLFLETLRSPFELNIPECGFVRRALAAQSKFIMTDRSVAAPDTTDETEESVCVL